MAITAGSNLNSVATPQKLALAQNYLDFTTAADGWAKQYLPEIMDREAEVFGNRTIGGFLSQVGAEEPMASDQVIWSEQGRLHLCYTGTINTSTSVVTITADIDSSSGFTAANHGVRDNDQVMVAIDNAGTTNTLKCHVSYVNGAAVTCSPYEYENFDDHSSIGTSTDGSVTCTILVYGSEYGKGTDQQTTSNSPTHKTFTQKPIILKDTYIINGSDTAQIGWVEVSMEDGTGGYLWYLKAESETRMRFSDYMEMAMLESVSTAAASHAVDAGATSATSDSLGTNSGHEGLWAAVESRGNVSTGIDGVNAATDLAEFDAILAEFDKQGSIEENMLFCNRSVSLAVDDMLASMNSYGSGGTSYGVFNNSEGMALNLGFMGFRRGYYDFYKSDMKYLNDRGTRGAINSKDSTQAIRGCFIPAGVSSVYDQMLGRNLKRPFLHVRFRASQTDDRRFKTWITGSVGAATSDLDAMQVNYLSERCLITQGANNFMLLKG